MRSFVVGVEGRNGKWEKMPHCKLCRVSKYVCAELFAEDFKEFCCELQLIPTPLNRPMFFHFVLHGSVMWNFAELNGLAGMKRWC